MKIIEIAATELKVPLPKVFSGSNYVYTHRKAMVIDVQTDAGITGSCYTGDDFNIGSQIAQLINSEFRELLTGVDPLATARCWEQMRNFARNILGDRRIALHAQALVDMALWDIVGKTADLPLSKIWGGYCDTRPVIVTGYYLPDKRLEAYAEDTLDLQARGYGGIKLKIGALSPQEDANRVEAVRESGGETFIIAVDANQAWSVAEAIEFAQRVVDYQVLWLEEPVQWENDATWLAQLRRHTNLPLCAGQSEWTLAGCRQLMAQGAIDICNFQPTYSGGVTPWLQMAGLAKAYGVQLANTGDPQISMHFMTAFAHSTLIELYHPDRDPVFYELVMPSEQIKNGTVSLSTRPGWGYDIDPDFVERYRVE